jgi:hypothetical protein
MLFSDLDHRQKPVRARQSLAQSAKGRFSCTARERRQVAIDSAVIPTDASASFDMGFSLVRSMFTFTQMVRPLRLSRRSHANFARFSFAA